MPEGQNDQHLPASSDLTPIAGRSIFRHVKPDHFARCHDEKDALPSFGDGQPVRGRRSVANRDNLEFLVQAANLDSCIVVAQHDVVADACPTRHLALERKTFRRLMWD